jgi:FtsP/CotA-like multicopper oxidase with cupredoxin domain
VAGHGLVGFRRTVGVAVRFTTYQGQFLSHCHDLEDEDMG